MRLHVLSDLHFEFGDAKIPVADADLVILAGDIHRGSEGWNWARNQFPDQPVLYVLGNHEFYRHSLPELTETLELETQGSHIHVLENNIAYVNDFTFLGCTLWTDFQLLPDPFPSIQIAEAMMSDYRVIKFGPEDRALRVQDTMRLHLESIAWLRQALADHDPSRTVVVTHHAPSPRSQAAEHSGSALGPAFASDLDSLITQSGVPLWIHGHTHHNVDFVIGATRVLTNQRGYPNQLSKGFDPSLIVEV